MIIKGTIWAPTLRRSGIVSSCVALLFLLGCSQPASEPVKEPSNTRLSTTTVDVNSWNEKGAAAYLDGRQDWWITWKHAARDQSTFCVSCHTTLPYVLARPELRTALGETGPSADEQKLIGDVTKRVRNWKTIQAYYRDSSTEPQQSKLSRGDESVLNAFILVSRDAESGTLSADTRLAFENMWAEQRQAGDERGSWPWQQFDLEPWESRASVYYGATLAAATVGIAPRNYRNSPEIQNGLDLLRTYVNREYKSQSLYNRVALLWASTKLPGLIDPDRRKEIVDEVLRKQHADGGWSFSSLIAVEGWNRARLMAIFNRRSDGTPQETASDGLATGMILSSLLQTGFGPNDPSVRRGLRWLVQHQNAADGSWTAYSVNKKRDPDSYIGRFMTDAATGYAVLALSEAKTSLRAQEGPRTDRIPGIHYARRITGPEAKRLVRTN